MSPNLNGWYHANAADPTSDIAPHFSTFDTLVREHDVRFVVELGVRAGHSTSAWLYMTAGRGHVYSVDRDATQLPARRGWTFIHGDDLDLDVLDQVPASFDLLFIDTSHDYEHTKAELEVYGSRVRPGGVIVLHDTANEHPEDHGEPIGPQEPFPVLRAMQEYATERGLRCTNDPSSWGLGVVYL